MVNRLQKKGETAWVGFETLTNNERWKHFSTKTSSSSDSGIWRAISEGLTMARALTTLNISFFSNLSKKAGMDQWPILGELEQINAWDIRMLTSKRGISSRSGIHQCSRSSWSRFRRPCFDTEGAIRHLTTIRFRWNGHLLRMYVAENPRMVRVMRWLCPAERIWALGCLSCCSETWRGSSWCKG